MSDPVTLYLLVLGVKDAKRRRRVRSSLRGLGREVGRGVYEVATTPRGMMSLCRAMQMDLDPEQDEVRVYPVCGRCRERAIGYGTSDFATVPVAWIF